MKKHQRFRSLPACLLAIAMVLAACKGAGSAGVSGEPGDGTAQNASSSAGSPHSELNPSQLETDLKLVTDRKKAAGLAAGGTRTVSVSETAVSTDFLGVGMNTLPMVFMKESMDRGYNDAYWQLEMKRILSVRPRFVRVWFQVDWMETVKGTYDFNSVKMQAFYKYIDALKAAGSEIQLNFGWKQGSAIHSWFGIPGILPERNAAPRDLAAFAASCSALLNQLIQVKQYTNVKYVSFFNEPNWTDYEAFGDERLYYIEMVKQVDAKLKADGRRSWVELWGPEEGHAPEWTEYIAAHASSYFDAFTFHDYLNYTTHAQTFGRRVAAAGNKRTFLTEFGKEPELNTFASGNTNFVIAAANLGVSGTAYWMMHGIYPTDPTDFALDGGFCLWDRPNKTNGVATVSNNFYELSLLTRYIPAHSTVLRVDTGAAEDIRAAAFKTAGGDYTVVVELDEAAGNRNLDVSFGKNIGKAFGRHTYTPAITGNANAIIPERENTLQVAAKLTDTAGSGRMVIVYTTLPAAVQVKTNVVEASVKAGETVNLTADVLGGTGGVTWSVAQGQGTVSASGVYTAAADAAKGSMAAVKAVSGADPNAWGVVLITVTE